MTNSNNHATYLNMLALEKYDPNLGSQIHKHLESMHLETPTQTDYDPQAAFDAFEEGIQAGFGHLGLDMDDDSLTGTPRRFAAMMVGELTRGLCYDIFPKITTTKALTTDLVIVKDIQVISLCEHHLQTIEGRAHIGYIPKKRWLGLSKFARVTEFFSRRPQVQERLTAQICAALQFILETDDVAVMIDAKHYCMKARGTLQHASQTQTDRMDGRFFTNPALRQEFMNAVR